MDDAELEVIAMTMETDVRRILSILEEETDIQTWAEAFLIDRKVRDVSPHTIIFYREKLANFIKYCHAQQITQIIQITPNILRQYILYLEETNHNSGGRAAYYRAVRAFLYWWEDEFEPADWKNPIRKVKAPRIPQEPLDPVEISVVKKMIEVCPNSFHGLRDKAIILALLDTGMRANELLSVNLEDIDLVTGDILVRSGKGRKSRYVFIGKLTRKAVRVYVRKRKDPSNALWVSVDGSRLHYDTFRRMLERRANNAGVQRPTAHSFRRAFALNMLRSGVDIYSLAKLMGHSGISVLQRYLKHTTEDTRAAHHKGSPIDRAF